MLEPLYLNTSNVAALLRNQVEDNLDRYRKLVNDLDMSAYRTKAPPVCMDCELHCNKEEPKVEPEKKSPMKRSTKSLYIAYLFMWNTVGFGLISHYWTNAPLVTLTCVSGAHAIFFLFRGIVMLDRGD